MRFNSKTALALLFIAGGAHAAEPGVYFGGSVGQSNVKIDDVDFDTTETGYKAFVGYNFLPYLGVEGGYVDFGSPSDNFGPASIELDLTGLEAFVVGTLPVGPVDLFAKAGAIEIKAELDAKNTVFGDLSEDNSDLYFAYGAGAAMNFGKFAIRIEAEGYDISDVDLYFISLGATYHL